jgi:uncharacterized membrane protein YqjE
LPGTAGTGIEVRRAADFARVLRWVLLGVFTGIIGLWAVALVINFFDPTYKLPASLANAVTLLMPVCAFAIGKILFGKTNGNGRTPHHDAPADAGPERPVPRG